MSTRGPLSTVFSLISKLVWFTEQPGKWEREGQRLPATTHPARPPPSPPPSQAHPAPGPGAAAAAGPKPPSRAAGSGRGPASRALRAVLVPVPVPVQSLPTTFAPAGTAPLYGLQGTGLHQGGSRRPSARPGVSWAGASHMQGLNPQDMRQKGAQGVLQAPEAGKGEGSGGGGAGTGGRGVGGGRGCTRPHPLPLCWALVLESSWGKVPKAA